MTVAFELHCTKVHTFFDYLPAVNELCDSVFARRVYQRKSTAF
jgi:hypothetical protein